MSKNTALTKWTAQMAMLKVLVFLSIHGLKTDEKMRFMVSIHKRPIVRVIGDDCERPMKAPLMKM